MKKVHVVDYGYGNLFSLKRALTYLGAEVVFATQFQDISDAQSLILPGVGAFGDGMAELKKRGFKEIILERVAQGCPLLGICLGMQFLFDRSFEFGEYEGFGFIKGSVKKIELKDMPFCKIPHVGWNSLQVPLDGMSWKHTILQGISIESEVYFVHSFAGYPIEKNDIIANTHYCDSVIPAVVGKNNVVGVQFHPEKSGEVGIAILKNFIAL